MCISFGCVCLLCVVCFVLFDCGLSLCFCRFVFFVGFLIVLLFTPSCVFIFVVACVPVFCLLTVLVVLFCVLVLLLLFFVCLLLYVFY